MYAGSIAESQPGQELEYFHVLPYQYGLFQAYWRQYYDADVTFQRPIIIPQPIEDSARELAGNDLVGYTFYLWNQHYHLSVAQRVKAMHPEVINVFGGPQLPHHAETFLRQNPQVDAVCLGEGENAFCEVMRQGRSRRWEEAPGVAWLDRWGGFHATPMHRLSQKDLEDCLSPYPMGVFDELIRQTPGRKWQMPMETSRGCPYGCHFCYWSGVDSRVVRRFSPTRAEAELRWAVDKGIRNIFLCDANFGLADQDEALIDYLVALVADTRAITSFVVQTPCDPNERVLSIHRKMLESHLACPITVGIQSRSAKVLQLAGRRYHPPEQLARTFSGYKKLNAECYSDMILGLPGESYASFAAGLTEVIECGQFDACYVYFFSPFVNTIMHDQGFRRTHGLKTIPQLIIDTHAPRESQEYSNEYQEIVISSATLSEEDWRRALVFKWLCQFVFFSRTLHMPLLLGLRLSQLDFRSTIERFMAPDPEQSPLLASVALRLREHALAMQQTGVPELLLSPHTRAIYWPIEQWLLLDLVHRDRFNDFYRESTQLLCSQVSGEENCRLIEQACSLNQALFRLPFLHGDLFWQGDFNLKELYRGLLADNIPMLTRGTHRYRIVRTRPEWRTWDGWHDHIQFSHLQKKHYLYGLSRV